MILSIFGFLNKDLKIFNGIEISQLDADVTFDGVRHAAGTWFIPMDQEFGNFVRQLFEVQDYPDLREYPEGPPDQPYDVAGWTLPYQMDVRVVEAASPVGADVRGSMSLVMGEAIAWDSPTEDAEPFDSPIGVGFNSNAVAAGLVPPAGEITGGGGQILIDGRENNGYRFLNAALAAGAQLRLVPGERGEEGEPGTASRYAVSNFSGSDALAGDLHLRATRGSASGPAVQKPRIGLYRPWNASMDEGWTRWLIERYDFDFQNLYNADVLAGDLSNRYDVIIVVDMSGNQIMNGFAPGSVPARYAGGIGSEGVRELDVFVRGGGTLVTLNAASNWAIDAFHLPVRNVVADVGRSDFFMSGSIVEMDVDPSHPVMTGMPARAKVIVGRSPVFTTEEGFEGRVFAKYPKEGSPLLSGYLLGEEYLQGFAAGVEATLGEGRVLLLGMRPQWRGQPFGNFRILFNAALYSDGVADRTPDGAAFWTAPPEEDEEGEGEVGNGRGR